MNLELEAVPVIQSGPLEVTVVQGEAQGSDQVEAGADRHAGSAYAPGVLGYLGFNENDVQIQRRFPSIPIAEILNLGE